jgi:16S rRNA (cytosine967-C5)-methyltransferase
MQGTNYSAAADASNYRTPKIMAPEPQYSGNTRALAANILGTLLQGKSSLSQLLAAQTTGLDRRDRAFVAELCYGTLRFHPELSGLVAQLLKKPMKAKDSDVQALLLLGAYQLRYMRVPDHAAISETVAATRALGKPWAKGLANAVLRNLQRRHAELDGKLKQSAKLNHPPWILDKLQQQWSAHWQDIVTANNQPPPMTLRVNRRQHSREAYQQILSQAGIAAQPCRFSDDGMQLQQACDVSDLPGFDTGSCSVQDEASQLVASLLIGEAYQAQAPRLHILDSCCAPGGKTAHLLEHSQALDLDAVDIDEHRLLRVTQNLERLELSANIITGDARKPATWWGGEHYDAILLDAPCSASGVIRRHPDIKILRQPQDLATLASQQTALLNALWPCLKPGGKLLYTTCSIFDEENGQVVGAFIDATADATHQPIDADWGYACVYGRQLLPHVDAHDGFYYAGLRKAI